MESIKDVLQPKTETKSGSKPEPTPEDLQKLAAEFQRYDPNRFPPHSSIALNTVKSWVYKAVLGQGEALILWASVKARANTGNAYGNGKTMLAKMAYNALMAVLTTPLGLPDITGMFVTTSDFLSNIKDSYETNSTSAYFRQFYQARFIIFDDFGTEHFGGDGGWYQEQFFKVLNNAYDARKPLLITSNLIIPDMQERLGGKNWSRLNGLARNGQGFLDMSAIPDQRKEITQ